MNDPQTAHTHQPQYRHPYQQQPSAPHPQPSPYPQPTPYAPPQPRPGSAPRFVPDGVGDFRRMCAALVDGFLTLLGGAVIALALPDGTDLGVSQIGTITTSKAHISVFAVLVCVFGVSFAHHVLGSVLFRGTVGKFLFFARVVREADAGRPRFWQSVLRWLMGLTWIPMQPLRSLVGADGDPYDDACGLRIVRSRELRRARQAG